MANGVFSAGRPVHRLASGLATSPENPSAANAATNSQAAFKLNWAVDALLAEQVQPWKAIDPRTGGVAEPVASDLVSRLERDWGLTPSDYDVGVLMREVGTLLRQAAGGARPYGDLLTDQTGKVDPDGFIVRHKPLALEPNTLRDRLKSMAGQLGYKGVEEVGGFFLILRQLVFTYGDRSLSAEGLLAKTLGKLFRRMDVSMDLGLGPLRLASVAWFTRDTRALIGQPSVQTFIRSLDAKLQGELDAGRQPNLWAEAYDFVAHHLAELSGGAAEAGDPEAVRRQTVRLLAVLFQDLAGVIGIGYAVNEKLAGLDTLGAWDRVLRNVRERGGQMQLYPPEIELRSDKNLYHYYNIAFLAQELAREAGSDPRGVAAAGVTAFVFNLEYEFAMRALRDANLRPGAVAELASGNYQPLVPAFDHADVQDMYLGYRAGLEACPQVPAVTFDEFSRRLGEAPTAFVRALVRDIFHHVGDG